jgi:hypothetical protein
MVYAVYILFVLDNSPDDYVAYASYDVVIGRFLCLAYTVIRNPSSLDYSKA